MKKDAIIKEDWIACPYCGKKQFPIHEAIIFNLIWKCQFSHCKKHFVVNIQPCQLSEKVIK